MSKSVQQMFSSIAGRYDLANDVLSLGMHRSWRNKAVRFAGLKIGDHVLDLCTGTGDLAYSIAKIIGTTGCVVGLDFVDKMLTIAKDKYGKKTNNISFLQADAMQLPFLDAAFDVVTIAFGIRNIDCTHSCLREIKRVLRPNGRVVVLEFGQPRLPIFANIYQLYSSHLMPHIGGILTGNRVAYQYLPETAREYPAGNAFLKYLEESGFVRLKKQSLMTGLAYIYAGIAEKQYI